MIIITFIQIMKGNFGDNVKFGYQIFQIDLGGNIFHLLYMNPTSFFKCISLRTVTTYIFSELTLIDPFH